MLWILLPGFTAVAAGVLAWFIMQSRMEVAIARGSSVCGRTLREAALAERTGVLLLALRPNVAAPFAANPSPDSCLDQDSILIAVGTPSQLTALHKACGSR